MTICPIALTVHCIGCPLVKFCPAKSFLGDYDTYTDEQTETETEKSEISDDTSEKNL